MVESEEAGSNTLQNWKDIPSLKLLNLMYDLTPSEFIVMVVTGNCIENVYVFNAFCVEVGLVPPSSVPVILREYRKDPQEF
jgi:translation initiation factor eIF-2B subunit delta